MLSSEPTAERVEIQVKVSICVTLKLSREDAESMHKYELCEVIDCILEASSIQRKDFCAQTASLRQIPVDYEIVPYWNQLPEDDCELTLTEEGLFPESDE